LRDQVNPDFHHTRDEAGEVLIAAEAMSAYSPEWFKADMRTDTTARLSGGRGSVRVFDTAIGTLVRRDYLRGGIPRHVIRDRYLWTGLQRVRSVHEFHVLRELRRRGLRVPTAIAASCRRNGPLYRASLIMRLIPGARTLAEALIDAGDRVSLLARSADAIADLHCQRVWHADLNAANILVDAADEIWVIDFDRARLDVRDRARLEGNLARLLRSLRKLLPAPVLHDVERAWPAMCERYRARLAGVCSPTP
jgi:3-deoxy-D-manno-octulosonic acid kinase